MESRKQKNIATAKHGMYVSMKLAGVLINGHMTKHGHKETDKRKEKNKYICRKRDRYDF